MERREEKFEVDIFPEGIVITKGEKYYFFSFYDLERMDGETILERLAR